VVPYWYETWLLTLREEQRPREFVKRILRRTFGPKRDEVTEGWRKLHNEEFHNLYLSPSIGVTEDKMARHVVRKGENRNA
jgi:hypothetical protein